MDGYTLAGMVPRRMDASDADEPMARDATTARQKQYTLRPRYRLGEAPADVLSRLQTAAQAHGHATWSSHWRCTACAQVSPWQELLAGEVEGTTVWVPVCPTADCAGISWLYFQPA